MLKTLEGYYMLAKSRSIEGRDPLYSCFLLTYNMDNLPQIW